MNTNTGKIHFKIRDMCFIAFFTAVISVLAQINVPMPGGVPFTLQTFAILLAGIILGAKKGTLSVFIYIILGAAGVPVFTQFYSGIGVILRETGGYILSFPIMALCAGIGSNLQNKFKSIWLKSAVLASGLIIGVVINFICGMVWGKFYLNCNFYTAFLWFVLPFILTSVIQIILAGSLGTTMKIILKKSGFLS